MNSKTKNLVLIVTIISIILLTSSSITQVYVDKIDTHEKRTTSSSPQTPRINPTEKGNPLSSPLISVNGLFGDSQVRMSLPTITNTNKINVYADAVSYGTTNTISVGTIAIQTNKLIPLDSDIPTKTITTSGLTVSFVTPQTITANGILLPLNSSFKQGETETLFLEISDDSKFSNLLLNLNYSFTMLSPYKTNSVFLSFSSVFGGPSSFTFYQSEDYYVRIYLDKGSTFTLLFSNDLMGSNESKAKILQNNEWTEMPQTDLQLFFVRILQSSNVSPSGGSSSFTHLPGTYLITATYSDTYGNSYYTPSVSYSISKIDLSNLSFDPSLVRIAKIKPQTINITIIKNQAPLSNEQVQVFFSNPLNNITTNYNKTTDNNGVIQVFFPQNMTASFELLICAGNYSAVLPGETIPPEIIVEDFQATGQYGTFAWNSSLVTVEFKASLYPTNEPLSNASVEVIEQGTTVINGRTNATGYFKAQYVSSLPAGNYSDALELRIYSEYCNYSSSKPLNISDPDIQIVLLTPDLVITNTTTLSLKIVNQNGIPLPDFEVNLTYLNQSLTNHTDSQGTVLFLMQDLFPGRQNASVTVVQQNNYPSKTTNIEFDVLTEGIVIYTDSTDYYVQINQSFTITGRLLSQDNQPISNTIVHVNNPAPDHVFVNIIENNPSDEEGNFVITLSINADTLNFYLELFVEGKNSTDTVIRDIVIYFQNVTTYISLTPTNADYPDFPVISGVLYWGNHVPIENKTVTVSYENQTISVVTDSNGRFQLTIHLSYAHTATITAKFVSDNPEKFLSCENLTQVTLNPATPTITTNTYLEHFSGDFITIKGTIYLDANPLPNLNVTLSLSPIILSQLTNASGEFSFNFNLTKPIGTYKLNITSAKTNYYASSLAIVEINITKYRAIIEILYNSTSVFSREKAFPVRVKDIYGNPVVGVTVNLTIPEKTKTYSLLTNQSGYCAFLIQDLLPSTYTMEYFVYPTNTTISLNYSTTHTINPVLVKTNVSYEKFVEGIPGNITINLFPENIPSYAYNLSIQIGEQTFNSIPKNNTVVITVTLSAGTKLLTISDSYGTVFNPYQYEIEVSPQKLSLFQFEVQSFKYYSTCEVILNVTNSLNQPVYNASIKLEIVYQNEVQLLFWGTSNTNGGATFSFSVPEEWSPHINSTFTFIVYVNHTYYPGTVETKDVILAPGKLDSTITMVSQGKAGENTTFRLTINPGVDGYVETYIDGQLYLTKEFPNSSFVLDIFFSQKGEYDITFILYSQGFYPQKITFHLVIEPHQVEITVESYYAQYLNNDSWILLYATLDNETSASGIQVIGYLGEQQVFQGITNQTGYLMALLPPDQWGIIQVTITHPETPLTTSFTLITKITYEKATIHLEIRPVLISNTPSLVIIPSVIGWDGEIPYSFTLYWKESTETVWNSLTTVFSPLILPVPDMTHEYDFYVEPTSQFNSLSLHYQIEGKTSFQITLLNTPTALSPLSLLLTTGNVSLQNSNVTCIITSPSINTTLSLATNSEGIVTIPAAYLNNTKHNYTITIYFTQADWINSSFVVFHLNQRTLTLNTDVNYEQEQLVLQLHDESGGELLSDELILNITYQGTTIYTQRIGPTTTIPFDWLPDIGNLSLEIRIIDQNHFYSEITATIQIQRTLSLTADVVIPQTQYGDNTTATISIQYNYYDSSLSNATIKIILANGDVLGVIQGVQPEIMLDLNTSTLLPGSYTIYLVITSPSGDILLQLTSSLTIISENVNAEIEVINYGYSTNITIIITVTDDDNNPVNEGKIAVTIKNKEEIVFNDYYYLSVETNNGTVVIVLPNFYLNTTLTIEVFFAPQNVFLNTYESVSVTKQVQFLPEKLSISATQAIQYGQKTVEIVVKGEHNQTIPGIDVTLLNNNFHAKTNENGTAQLEIPLLKPGNITLKVKLQYPVNTFCYVSYLNFQITKRQIDLEFPTTITAEYGDIVNIDLYQGEDETYVYKIQVYSGTSLLYEEKSNTTQVLIDTTLLSSAGNYSIIITREETSLTFSNSQIIMFVLEKGNVVITITESQVSGQKIYLKGIVRASNGQQINEGQLELVVSQAGIIVGTYQTNITQGYWEFKLTLELEEGKTYTLTIKYLENEKYLTTSLFAMQISSEATQNLTTPGTSALSSILTKIAPILLPVIAVPSIGMGLEKLLRRKK